MPDTGQETCDAEVTVNDALRLRCSLTHHGGRAHHDQGQGYRWFDPWRAASSLRGDDQRAALAELAGEAQEWGMYDGMRGDDHA